jgi:DNA-binding NarL/FixJ family response regulator
VNLILADSNDLIRIGLRTILMAELDVTIVGEARNERELVAQLDAFGASVVLIDFTSEGFTIDNRSNF